MPPKPKTNQPQTPNKVQQRDFFETPRYATELLIPFIPKNIVTVWEMAAGKKRISSVLEEVGYDVLSTDIGVFPNVGHYNFITDTKLYVPDLLITNPPFSIKQKFFEKCLQYNSPFALLIPADYSGWIIQSLKNGAEKIIPERRIDYITPNIIENIWKGETKKLVEKETGKKYKNWYKIPDEIKEQYKNRIQRYDKIENAPAVVLAKYSTSQFHSLWLTVGFGIGQSETFVPLTKQMKENIL